MAVLWEPWCVSLASIRVYIPLACIYEYHSSYILIRLKLKYDFCSILQLLVATSRRNYFRIHCASFSHYDGEKGWYYVHAGRHLLNICVLCTSLSIFSQINFVFIVIALRVIVKNQKGKALRTSRKGSKQKSIARYVLAKNPYWIDLDTCSTGPSGLVLVSLISLAK